MRAYVFTDPALASSAGQFVWLAIDTEKQKNAPFRKRYPVQALPTFFILDPADQKVALRWVGGATLPQLQKLLASGTAAVKGGGDATAQALARADRLYGEGRNAEAAAAYREALAAAPAGWPQYGRTTESLLFALSTSDSNEACALVARDAYPRVRGTPSAPGVASSGLDCAVSLPGDHPLRAKLIATLEADAREVVDDRQLPIAADDRSGVYISLLEARKDAGDSTGARHVAEQWASFLEGEAAKAKTPEARAVFDSHRLSAYLELGRPERAIPMLNQSERDFPNDYNPPARLANAYKAMKRWDEALAASDRALEKAYGPRKLLILQNRADIYVGRGEPQKARETLEDALHQAEAMPEGQRSENTIATIRKKLAAMKS